MHWDMEVCWDPKGQLHCTTNFLTAYLAMIQWAETLLHAHLLPWFQRTPQGQGYRAPWQTQAWSYCGWSCYPMTRHGPASKPGKEIISLHFRHEHHECLLIALSSCTVTGEKKALLEHRSSPSNADARNRLGGFLPFLFFWLRAGPGQGAQVWHVHHIYLGPVRSITIPASESPCRLSGWTSPADLLCDLRVHDSLLLGSVSGCLDSSLNIRRTSLHKDRAVAWDTCNLR